MESTSKPALDGQQTGIVGGIIFSHLLHLVIVGLIIYGGYFTTESVGELRQDNKLLWDENKRLENKIDALEKTCFGEKATLDTANIQKREVISDSKVDLSSLIRGPPGPPGPTGKDGRDGTPGRDYSSLSLLRDVINETVQREWDGLSQSVPTYGGVTYIRWGRNSCPSTSQQIYRGYMAGSAYYADGGGSNYQCLPDDPDYMPDSPTGHSLIRPIQYETFTGRNMFGSDVFMESVPCVACETMQRVSQIIIPGKTRCPSSDWNLDYQGYLMTETVNGSPAQPGTSRGRGSYTCVDGKAEKSTIKLVKQWMGGAIYPVSVDCKTAEGNTLFPCPPYKDNTALSCVVCSR